MVINGVNMKIQGLLLIIGLSLLGFNAFARTCSEIEKSYIKERCDRECDNLSTKHKNERKITDKQNYKFTGNIKTVQCTESGALLGTCNCKLE